MKGIANEVKVMVARAGGKVGRPVSIAWFSPEAWQRLETIPEAEIEMSYDDYQHNLESIDREFKANGLKYELVPVDIDLMTAWCHCNGLKIDSKGRATYGAVLASSRKDPTALTKPKEPASDGDGMSISKALRDVLDANGMSADDFAAAFERCMSCTRG